MGSVAAAAWVALRYRGRGSRARGRLDRFVTTPTYSEDVAVPRSRDRRRGRRPAQSTRRNPFTQFLEGEIARARVDLTPSEILIAGAAIGITLVLLILALGGSLGFGIVMAMLGAAAPLFWLRRRHGKMLSEFAAQLPPMIDSIIASVRAGNDLTTALARVAHEAPEPMRSALGQSVREIEFGMGVEEALTQLAERTKNEDLELVVSAIAIEQAVGGNLPKVLELLATTTRQRVTLRQEVRSLTAQQRYSAYMLSLFPLVAFLGLLLISPDYLSPMLDGGGRIALIVAGLMVLFGFTIMRRIGDVEL